MRQPARLGLGLASGFSRANIVHERLDIFARDASDRTASKQWFDVAFNATAIGCDRARLFRCSPARHKAASIGIGPLGTGGFGLNAALVVYAPKLDKATAQSLVEAAHEVCPYSNATRGNIEVTLSVVE